MQQYAREIRIDFFPKHVVSPRFHNEDNPFDRNGQHFSEGPYSDGHFGVIHSRNGQAVQEILLVKHETSRVEYQVNYQALFFIHLATDCANSGVGCTKILV